MSADSGDTGLSWGKMNLSLKSGAKQATKTVIEGGTIEGSLLSLKSVFLLISDSCFVFKRRQTSTLQEFPTGMQNLVGSSGKLRAQLT